jgi:hypothetical protein
MHEASAPAEEAMRVTHAALLVDMMDDVVRVANLTAVDLHEVIERLTAPDDPMAAMPFLAQMRQFIFYRLRNRTQTWEPNDLIDVLFLSCAAGYADVVVGERRTIGYLRQARDVPPKAHLATSLAEAVELLASG